MHTNHLNGSRKMVYVNDDVPPETTDLMRIACKSRAIEFVELHAPSFDFRPELQMDNGDLLFRPAISSASIRVEQFLFSEGVATLYQPPDSTFFQYSLATIIHQRAGLPFGLSLSILLHELLISLLVTLLSFVAFLLALPLLFLILLLAISSRWKW